MEVGGIERGGWGLGREEDKPHFGVAVATWDSYKAPSYHVEEMFMEQWQQFQVIAPQLVPSLTVTSQGRQNA